MFETIKKTLGIQTEADKLKAVAAREAETQERINVLCAYFYRTSVPGELKWKAAQALTAHRYDIVAIDYIDGVLTADFVNGDRLRQKIA